MRNWIMLSTVILLLSMFSPRADDRCDCPPTPLCPDAPCCASGK